MKGHSGLLNTAQPAASVVPPAQWDKWVKESEEYTAYHLSAWGEVIREVFGHPYYLLSVHSGEKPLLCPFIHVRSRLFGDRLVSVAFANYGGPVGHRSPENVAEMMGQIRELMRHLNAPVAEIRHTSRMDRALPVRTHKVTYHLSLRQDEGQMWEGFPKKIRNWVRKGEKNGFVVRSGGLELVRDFYIAYSRNMRDLGSPVYPMSLFAAVMEKLPGSRAYVVYAGGAVAGGAITVGFQERLHIPWASVIKPFKPLGANFLLHWVIIRDAIRRGYKVLDFGQSSVGASTTHFKEQWGANPIPLYWEYVLSDGACVPRTDHGDPRYAMFVSLWKRLPVRIANWLGPKIVRGIP
jgi:serine/alanine adding enzyme